MPKRKQTTASPEKIPMNTESTRNKRSSRNTARNRAPRDRRGNDGGGSAIAKRVSVGELGDSSKTNSLRAA